MRVLVVDDEPAVRSVVRRALDPIEVIEAGDGPSALSLLDEQSVDVVVLDVMLPDMDGFEVLRRLRANPRTSALPVVMLTALVAEGDHVQGYRAGADGYVTKPFDIDELAGLVYEVHSRSGQEREAIRQRELGRAELLHHIESQFRF